MTKFTICGNDGMNHLSIDSDDMSLIDKVIHILEDRDAEIKRTFNLDDYIGKYAMHCPTYGKARAFMHRFGIPERIFPWNTDFTMFAFDIECLREDKQFLLSREVAIDKGYTILEYDDFNWEGMVSDDREVSYHYRYVPSHSS